MFFTSEDNSFREASEAKASLKRAIESVVVDAKPSDLPLIRLKSG